MGRTLASMAEDFEVVAALERRGHPAEGEAYPAIPRLIVGSRLERKVDVLIDFSSPEGALEKLEQCVGLKVPAVICATGFTEGQRRSVEAAARTVPVVFSANMSVGVGLLARILPEVEAALGPEFDVDVVETHHRTKKDAPSGTARMLAERLSRPPKSHSLRSGDEVGEHRVIFGGPGERIEILHRATSREVFARGALRAARFVLSAPKGLYSMLDVIAKA